MFQPRVVGATHAIGPSAGFAHSAAPAEAADEPASQSGVSEEMLRRFLTYLAVERHVSASTQEQAFNALLFFYRHVLHVQVRGLDSM